MTAVKIPARDIILEVETTVADTFVAIENLASVTVNRADNEETADITDFDSQGAYEQWIMQRGASLALAGQELKDDTTGVLQPGRARIEDLAGETALASESHGRIRFRHPMETNWKIWTATFSVGESGGATNDASAWAATITKSGLSSTAVVV
jgi:hypothetical protein